MEVADTCGKPDELLLEEERREELFLFVGELPAELRSVLLLHYLEDFPVEEVSWILGLPAGTVKSRLYEARRRLRVKFERKRGNEKIDP